MSARTKETLRRLRGTALASLVMLMIGVASVTGAKKSAQQAHTQHKIAETTVEQTKARLAAAQHDASEIDQHLQSFLALQSRGIIGEEQRLSWIEHLRKAQEVPSILRLEYEISPRRPLFSNPLSKDNEKFYFYRSPLRIQIELLHEEALLQFLDDMEQDFPAHVRIKNCLIERKPQPAIAQLKADCMIDLITVDHQGHAS